jgi:hypothetical protein
MSLSPGTIVNSDGSYSSVWKDTFTKLVLDKDYPGNDLDDSAAVDAAVKVMGRAHCAIQLIGQTIEMGAISRISFDTTVVDENAEYNPSDNSITINGKRPYLRNLLNFVMARL